MKNNKARLAFEMLEKELEVMGREESLKILGGTDYKYVTNPNTGTIERYHSNSNGMSWFRDYDYYGAQDPDWSGPPSYYTGGESNSGSSGSTGGDVITLDKNKIKVMVDSGGIYLLDTTDYYTPAGVKYNKVSFDGQNWSDYNVQNASTLYPQPEVQGTPPNWQTIPTNWGGAQVEQDPDGTSYYRDNTGRVHYLMDGSIILNAIKNTFLDIKDYFQALAGWSIEGKLSMPPQSSTVPSLMISIEVDLLNQYLGGFANKTGYMGSDGNFHLISQPSGNDGSTGNGGIVGFGSTGIISQYQENDGSWWNNFYYFDDTDAQYNFGDMGIYDPNNTHQGFSTGYKNLNTGEIFADPNDEHIYLSTGYSTGGDDSTGYGSTGG